MRSSRFSEMPCSNECASSCTSSQGMPKTCTRNASIRRWRVTMRLADVSPMSVKRRRLRSSRTTKPSSTSRRTISSAVGCETPTARARFACVASMPASFIQNSFSRYSSTVDVRASIARSLPACGAAFRASRYRRGRGGTSGEHGAHARRGSARGRHRCARPRRPRAGRATAPAGRRGATAPCANRARRRRCSRPATRRASSSPGRGRSAASAPPSRSTSATSRSAARPATSTWPRASPGA